MSSSTYVSYSGSNTTYYNPYYITYTDTCNIQIYSKRDKLKLLLK